MLKTKDEEIIHFYANEIFRKGKTEKRMIAQGWKTGTCEDGVATEWHGVPFGL